MSTGADCYFYEEKPRVWHYKIQRWPYGEWPEYDTSPAFDTFGKALRHLNKHHANPGGFSVRPLDGCKHDLLNKREGDTVHPNECERCGHFIAAA